MARSKRIAADSLPKELLDEIRVRFESDPRIRDMRVQQVFAQREGRIADALQLGKQLDYLYTSVVSAYIAEIEKQGEDIAINDLPMSDEDKETMTVMTVSLFMLADMMETVIMDENDLLHKYNKNLNMEMFDDFRELTKMVKGKMKYLSTNTDLLQDSVWSDQTDNFYGLLQNKARAILRRAEERNNKNNKTKKS